MLFVYFLVLPVAAMPGASLIKETAHSVCPLVLQALLSRTDMTGLAPKKRATCIFTRKYLADEFVFMEIPASINSMPKSNGPFVCPLFLNYF